MRNAALVAYYRQLGTMLDAGLPMIQALEALGSQSGRKLKAASADMAHRIAKGATFSDAFAAQGRVFPAEDQGMIAAAERTGRLDITLRKMADTHERLLKMGRDIAINLIYPAILVHVAILALAVLKWTTNKQVSDSTEFLVIAFGVLYGGGLVIYTLLFSHFRVAPLRHALDSLVRMLPVAGSLCRYLATARFIRTFEALYVAGLDHPSAVKLAAEGCGNGSMEKKFKAAIPALREGTTLGEALGLTNAFDAMHAGMISTADQSGQLEEMLPKVAQNCEESAESRISGLSTAIPVLLYVGIAVLVGVMVIQFWLGYFSQLESIM